MPLHLIKLCVGCDRSEDLKDWIAKARGKEKRGEKPEHIHTTRMVPKRADELVDGGSLYWVIRGQICAASASATSGRSSTRKASGAAGVVLDPKIMPVTPRPYRAFQGWRYLAAKDAPADLDAGAGRGGTCRRRCGANCASSACSEPCRPPLSLRSGAIKSAPE